LELLYEGNTPMNLCFGLLYPRCFLIWGNSWHRRYELLFPRYRLIYVRVIRSHRDLWLWWGHKSIFFIFVGLLILRFLLLGFSILWCLCSCWLQILKENSLLLMKIQLRINQIIW